MYSGEMTPTNLTRKPPYPMGSMASMVSMGYLSPGHSYVPKKIKPDKPYGLVYTTVMNRTHRGPGRKYLKYALACLLVCLLFLASAALYFGHRNVSRLRVLRTEVFGALFIIVGIVAFALMGHFIHKARVASNHWRANIRFRAEGLHLAAPVNYAYCPEAAETNLQTGTYGPKALKAVPKPKTKRRGKNKSGSKLSLQGPHMFDKRSQGPPVSQQDQAPGQAPVPVPQGYQGQPPQQEMYPQSTQRYPYPAQPQSGLAPVYPMHAPPSYQQPAPPEAYGGAPSGGPHTYRAVHGDPVDESIL